MNDFNLIKYRSLVCIVGIILLFEPQLMSQNITACSSKGNIYSFNPKNCSERLICHTNCYNDIAYCNGGLYGVIDYWLYLIDTTYGCDIFIADCPEFFNGLVGDESGQLYLASHGSHLIYNYDIASNTFSVVGDVGINCYGDLVIMGHKLYLLGVDNRLISITLNPFSYCNIGNLNIDFSYQSFGLVTVSEMNADYLVVSARNTYGNNLYKVDASTATATLMCPLLQGNYTEEIYGLALANTFSDENIIYIPNVFSPDNDGSNDIFRILGENIGQIEINVFDRWGNMVFESQNINDGWDGCVKNKDCPVGVYYYNASITFTNGMTRMKKGNITLVR